MKHTLDASYYKAIHYLRECDYIITKYTLIDK